LFADFEEDFNIKKNVGDFLEAGAGLTVALEQVGEDVAADGIQVGRAAPKKLRQNFGQKFGARIQDGRRYEVRPGPEADGRRVHVLPDAEIQNFGKIFFGCVLEQLTEQNKNGALSDSGFRCTEIENVKNCQRDKKIK
jgi:hypothetical protein